MAITAAARTTELLHLPCHDERALDLLAGDELRCLAGQVQLATPTLYHDPGGISSANLTTGRGWRAAAACRVSVMATGDAPARLQHQPAPTSPARWLHQEAPSSLATPSRLYRTGPTWLGNLVRRLSLGMARG